MIGNKVTEISAGEQPRLQLNNIIKKNAIKTPKIVNIFMTYPTKKFIVYNAMVGMLYK